MSWISYFYCLLIIVCMSCNRDNMAKRSRVHSKLTPYLAKRRLAPRRRPRKRMAGDAPASETSTTSTDKKDATRDYKMSLESCLEAQLQKCHKKCQSQKCLSHVIGTATIEKRRILLYDMDFIDIHVFICQEVSSFAIEPSTR